MIEINLLPEEFRRREIEIGISKTRVLPLALWTIAIAILFQILLYIFVVCGRYQINKLKRELGSLNPQHQIITIIKNKLQVIDKKVGAIEILMSSRKNWSRILNGLSDSVTPNIWLTELRYGEEARTKRAYIAISGNALGKSEEATFYVARFIKSLKENQDFFEYIKEIELLSMKNAIFSGREIMRFDLLCRLKPEER